MSKSQLVFGIHAVVAIMKSQRAVIDAIWLLDDRRDARLGEIEQLGKSLSVGINRVGRKVLDDKVPGGNHQGVIASCIPTQLQNENQLKDYIDSLTEPPFLLVLDGVQDPHNLGACLRSADAAGVHAVLAPRDGAVAITPVVRKVACGAAEFVPFVQVTNLARTLRWLKDQGIWLVGLDGYAEQSIYQTEMTGALAMVLGAEGKGLRRLTREHCDFTAKIPMAGQVESLNVSVATGVCLFEAKRQRDISA